jgi:serine protease Do
MSSVKNQPVTTPAQEIAAVEAARKAGRSSVLLLVRRGNSPEAFVGVDITGK